MSSTYQNYKTKAAVLDWIMDTIEADHVNTEAKDFHTKEGSFTVIVKKPRHKTAGEAIVRINPHV